MSIAQVKQSDCMGYKPKNLRNVSHPCPFHHVSLPAKNSNRSLSLKVFKREARYHYRRYGSHRHQPVRSSTPYDPEANRNQVGSAQTRTGRLVKVSSDRKIFTKTDESLLNEYESYVGILFNLQLSFFEQRKDHKGTIAITGLYLKVIDEKSFR